MYFQCGVARHHVGVGIFRLPTRKGDVTRKKDIIQITEKYRVVDKKLRERLELKMLMFVSCITRRMISSLQVSYKINSYFFIIG